MGEGRSERSSSYGLLDLRVQKWIWEQRWSELHDIQERSIPLILEGKRDLLISAATGRGKTEAAFLPICSKLVSQPKVGVKALYVSPLKALINDQFRRMESLCQTLDIPVHRWHGDVEGAKKKALLRKPSGILLITPESLEALFVLRGTQLGRLFSQLDYIVVDEIHAFIGSERGAQLRSLLHRIELVTRCRIPRIGLSATIGDLGLAAEFMRFDGADDVAVVNSTASGQELQLQVRGYVTSRPRGKSDDEEEEESLAERAVASHLFKVLRGQNNLVFANSRASVEEYADRLRQNAEDLHLPQEFWPHHGNLSKGVREDVERMLKEPGRPTTAVCTSTLELGIDIGAVASVAQIGVPPSVASLRQRMGRSGRRGQPAVLRAYLTEWEMSQQLAPQDAIRSRLVTALAMVELLIKGWCEPPAIGAYNFSTLVQQVLSAIAQFGGVKAQEVWGAYCRRGPFRTVDQSMFASLLRAIAAHDLIVQDGDGTLLLGVTGERIVNHYTFYTAFQTYEEYQVVAGSRVLGTLPLTFGVGEGALIVFAGRRWRVMDVDDDAKVLMIEPAPGGNPPKFEGGELGMVHAEVRRKMRALYEAEELQVYLDDVGKQLLKEGRASYRALGLDSRGVIQHGSNVLLFPWGSDQAHNALALMLRQVGMDAAFDGVAVSIHDQTADSVTASLREVSEHGPDRTEELARGVETLKYEKYDAFLPIELLQAEFAARRLDIAGAIACARNLCRAGDGPAHGGRSA